MIKKITVLVLVLLLFGTIASLGSTDFIPKVLSVQFKADVSEEQINNFIDSHDFMSDAEWKELTKNKDFSLEEEIAEFIDSQNKVIFISEYVAEEESEFIVETRFTGESREKEEIEVRVIADLNDVHVSHVNVWTQTPSTQYGRNQIDLRPIVDVFFVSDVTSLYITDYLSQFDYLEIISIKRYGDSTREFHKNRYKVIIPAGEEEEWLNFFREQEIVKEVYLPQKIYALSEVEEIKKEKYPALFYILILLLFIGIGLAVLLFFFLRKKSVHKRKK